jgi:ATP-binding protein involved in chromosome partitioning
MMLTKEQVLSALSTVMDPDLDQDLVSLGMIENLQVEGTEVSLDVILTTPACPLRHKIEKDVRDAVSKLVGVSDIKVNMGSRVRSANPVMEKAPSRLLWQLHLRRMAHV